MRDTCAEAISNQSLRPPMRAASTTHGGLCWRVVRPLLPITAPQRQQDLTSIAHTEAGKEQIKAEEALLLPRGIIHPFNRL